jgi:hypothetical protein
VLTDVFVVLVEDRHCDVEVAVFTDEPDAVEYAISQVPEEDHEVTDFSYVLSPGMVAAGWVCYIPYGNEGDCVRVVRCEVVEGS